MRTCSSAEISAGDDEDVANGLRELRDVLAGPVAHDLLDDLLTLLFAETQFPQARRRTGAGIGQLQVLAIIVDVARVGERKDGFASIAFAASDRGDGAGRRDGGLGRIPNAVASNAGDHRIPVKLRSAPGAARRR